MPLTPDERVRARVHLGYPAVTPLSGILLGIPQPLQASFLVDANLDNLVEAMVPRVRSILGVLDDLEAKLIEAQDYLVAEKVGAIQLRSADTGKTHPDLLEREYRRWAERLSDVVGAPIYPYSARFRAGGGGGIRVIPRGM